MTEESIKKGETVPEVCPDCGGSLRADDDFVLTVTSVDRPEKREPFWSTTCDGCRHRFNYVPGTGRLVRIERWLPPLDLEHFNNSPEEMLRFEETHFAGLARDAF